MPGTGGKSAPDHHEAATIEVMTGLLPTDKTDTPESEAELAIDIDMLDLDEVSSPDDSASADDRTHDTVPNFDVRTLGPMPAQQEETDPDSAMALALAPVMASLDAGGAKAILQAITDELGKDAGLSLAVLAKRSVQAGVLVVASDRALFFVQSQGHWQVDASYKKADNTTVALRRGPQSTRLTLQRTAARDRFELTERDALAVITHLGAKPHTDDPAASAFTEELDPSVHRQAAARPTIELKDFVDEVARRPAGTAPKPPPARPSSTPLPVNLPRASKPAEPPGPVRARTGAPIAVPPPPSFSAPAVTPPPTIPPVLDPPRITDAEATPTEPPGLAVPPANDLALELDLSDELADAPASILAHATETPAPVITPTATATVTADASETAPPPVTLGFDETVVSEPPQAAQSAPDLALSLADDDANATVERSNETPAPDAESTIEMPLDDVAPEPQKSEALPPSPVALDPFDRWDTAPLQAAAGLARKNLRAEHDTVDSEPEAGPAPVVAQAQDSEPVIPLCDEDEPVTRVDHVMMAQVGLAPKPAEPTEGDTVEVSVAELGIPLSPSPDDDADDNDQNADEQVLAVAAAFKPPEAALSFNKPPAESDTIEVPGEVPVPPAMLGPKPDELFGPEQDDVPKLVLSDAEPPPIPAPELLGLDLEKTRQTLHKLAGSAPSPERAQAALTAALAGEPYNPADLPDGRTIALGVARSFVKSGMPIEDLVADILAMLQR
jgi:hypothetical protein